MKWKFDLDVIIMSFFLSLSLQHPKRQIMVPPFFSLFSLFHLLFVKPRLDPRRIRAIHPDNPRRHQKHNPVHLHFFFPSLFPFSLSAAQLETRQHKNTRKPRASHLRSMSISISLQAQNTGGNAEMPERGRIIKAPCDFSNQRETGKTREDVFVSDSNYTAVMALIIGSDRWW